MLVKKFLHPIIRKKESIAKDLFGGKCFFCPKKYGKYFSFHHLNYDPNRKTYKDFKNTVDYHKYLIPEILADPSRFLLVCRAHHDKLEWAVSIKNETFWPRFLLGIMCTDSSRDIPPMPESSTTQISLENNRVVGYKMNNNSALKTYLARYLTLDSMFGETSNESE